MAFNQDKMMSSIADTRSRVFSFCPRGAQEWLSEHLPEAVAHLEAAGCEVDAAFEAQDEARLGAALQVWERYHLAAWRRFEERPLVIERQEELFGSALPAAER